MRKQFHEEAKEGKDYERSVGIRVSAVPNSSTVELGA